MLFNASSELYQFPQWSFMSSKVKLKDYFFQILVFLASSLGIIYKI